MTSFALIENFKFDAGPVAVERRNRGFTLIHAETGVPDRSPASYRTRRSRRYSILVTVEGTMGSVRPLRTHRRPRRTGRAHYRGSGNLLDRRLNARAKIRKVELRVGERAARYNTSRDPPRHSLLRSGRNAFDKDGGPHRLSRSWACHVDGFPAVDQGRQRPELVAEKTRQNTTPRRGNHYAGG